MMNLNSMYVTCSMAWSQWTVRWTRPSQGFLVKGQVASTVQHPSMHPQLTVPPVLRPERPKHPGCPEHQSRHGQILPLLAKPPCLSLMWLYASHHEVKLHVTTVVPVMPCILSISGRTGKW